MIMKPITPVRSFARAVFLLGCLGSTISAGAALAASSDPSSGILWSIGTRDNSSIEFAPRARSELTFTVGESIASRDFPGNQEGSLGADGQVIEKPYAIAFDLAEPPQGNYELVLDLIYQVGSPRQLKIQVNNQRGIFPVRLVPQQAMDNVQANGILLAGQHLVVPIPAAWLKSKGNRITILPVGVGGLAYDALAFQKAPAHRAVEELRVEPTVFFRKKEGKLVEICQLVAPFQERFARGAATVRFGGQAFRVAFTNDYDFGLLSEALEIPAAACSGQATVELQLDDRTQRVTHDFVPAKQWKVFICPKVHNDVGYTDLQPNVNELDNRNTDTVLDILGRYPFYKFNFETAWLVDNYLDCRTPAYRRQFFDYAKSGRAAINALYLNLMTGICSGEELYRAMYFTHRLHKERGSNFDFACITDAPSHSWFLPTLLSDVGIKAFANGSNQTRAPILRYSGLNEDSPFYWEGMNG